jgi:hypothetical protein
MQSNQNNQNNQTNQTILIHKMEQNYNHIISMDSNDSNFSINNSVETKSPDFNGVNHKNREIEMVKPEPYIDFNDLNGFNDSDDDLSEFSEFKDNNFDCNDYLEETLDLDLNFDFDVIFTPENNSEILQFIEIKNKIVNRIKLNALDLSYIKKLEDSDKFDLIKLFNHMV